jgi:cell division protein FtsB
MNETTERSFAGNMERHLQTILITFITGSIVFAANYFFTDKESKAVLITNLSHLTAQVAEMRADLRTLRAEQATKSQVEGLEERVRALERAQAAATRSARQ